MATQLRRGLGGPVLVLGLGATLFSGCDDDDGGSASRGGETGQAGSGAGHSSGGHAGSSLGGHAGQSRGGGTGGTNENEGGDAGTPGGSDSLGGMVGSCGGTSPLGGTSNSLGGTNTLGGTGATFGGSIDVAGSGGELAGAGGSGELEGGQAGATAMGGDSGQGGSAAGGTTGGGGQGYGGVVNDPFLEPRWLGACTPIELSDDGKTVLANEGIWTEQTGFEAIPGLTSASLTTPLAMSRDGKVVFGTSASSLGSELVRWTHETGTIGLGRRYPDLAKPASNGDGSQLVWWDRESEVATPEPYQWFPSTGVSKLQPLGLGSTCSFPWAEHFKALSSSDGWTLLFSGVGPSQVDFCSAVFGDDSLGVYGNDVAHGFDPVMFDAMSGDGNVLVAAAAAPNSAAVIRTVTGESRTLSCLFPFRTWEGSLHCYTALTSIPELDFTGAHGLGTEIAPDGQTIATFIDGVRVSRLRDRLPAYCVAPAGLAGQISGDGSVVLGVGTGRSQQGCFLADTTTSAPPLPSLSVADFGGFGCSTCAGDALVVGSNHQCATRPDQTVACWGKGSAGELGDGALVDSLTPRPVSDLSSVEQLAATANHTCARTTDGSVYCWGQNAFGQLGDGTRIDRPVPTRVTLPLAASYVAAGDQHSCAVLEDHTVRCWGRNQRGQLGNGTSIDSLAPVTVSGVGAVTQVAAGATRSCALNQTGGVVCWGNGSLVPTGGGVGNVTQISLYGGAYCFLDGPAGSQNLDCSGGNRGLNGLNEWFQGGELTVIALHAGPASWCLQTANGLQSCTVGDARFYGEEAYAPVVAAIVPGGNGTCRLLPSGVVQCQGALWGPTVPRCSLDAAPVTASYEPALPP